MGARTGSVRKVVAVSIQGPGSVAAQDLQALSEVADVTFLARGDRGAMSRAEALFAFRDAAIVAVTPKVAPVFDRTLLEGLPHLEAIALFATGYDMLDVDLLGEHGVSLSVLPEYSTRSVAEHTIGLLLTVSRRLHLSNDRARGRVPADVSLRGFELDGKVLGIIGCGRIGSRVAELAQAFGMTTIAYDIDPKPVDGVRYVDFPELLVASDLITLHRPMGYGEPPMLGSRQLARVRPGAVLVNSSRAALVDSAAVVDAVRAGRLRGYAVDDDVFVTAEAGDLLAEGRIVQTGHSAWWSDEVLERGGRMWAEHIRALALGKPLDLVLDARPLHRSSAVR